MVRDWEDKITAIIVNANVRVSVDKEIEGGKTIKGKLKSRDSNSITVLTDEGKRVEIPWDNIAGITEVKYKKQ
ncbi:hypothetical protein ACFLVY_00045 [Chloroflexota bacterium]